MAPCLGDPRHLAACIGGNFGQIGDWWSPTAHPDSVLGVPEARLGPSPALYTDNYYARVLLNRTDVAGPPLTDADFDAAARLLEERFSAVVVVEDFARSALQLVCAVGLDPGLARPLLRTRVRPYAAHEAMMIVPESDAHLGKRNADALRARFYRRNQLDYALYSRARATSSRRLAACARSRPEVERLWRAPLEEMSSAPPEPTPPPQPGGVSIDDLFGCSGGRIEQQPDGVYLLACPRSAAAKASSWWSGQVGNEAPPRKLGQPVPGAECWREGFSWQTCCAGRFGSQGNLEPLGGVRRRRFACALSAICVFTAQTFPRQSGPRRGGPGDTMAGTVAAPRELLREILEDGTCPAHLQRRLRRLLGAAPAGLAPPPAVSPKGEAECSGARRASITDRIWPLLPLVTERLALAEIVAVRACSSAGLEWAMARRPHRLGELGHVHDRIRSRLWIHRLFVLNEGTADEAVYEARVRGLADDAQGRRLEAEMAEARRDMEDQIRSFQLDVDRRMDLQAGRVHAIVEERVQHQLDAILHAEMQKVQEIVEDLVQSMVRAVVQAEVHAAAREMRARLARLARENDRLRAAFLEQLDHSSLCLRFLVWARSSSATAGLLARVLWATRRRLGAWVLGVPPDRRGEGLRSRLEPFQRAGEDEGGEAAAAAAGLRPAGSAWEEGDPLDAVAAIAVLCSAMRARQARQQQAQTSSSGGGGGAAGGAGGGAGEPGSGLGLAVDPAGEGDAGGSAWGAEWMGSRGRPCGRIRGRPRPTMRAHSQSGPRSRRTSPKPWAPPSRTFHDAREDAD
ncbi:unnamed protein product [Prorocentrum cordatum]|uniref:Uncharacterized protein n=1 Tax=Prorocentrum cordatum TaxID=2364126 RepID=A0ABN9UMU1_9DINO|nr:unnamed protein product [Polarella glacialis]